MLNQKNPTKNDFAQEVELHVYGNRVPATDVTGRN